MRAFAVLPCLALAACFDDPVSLAFSADNLHPSVAGRRAYAIATADLLLKRFPAVFSGLAAQPH
jgi:hypothetical protein